jgi:hypothetical protein
VGGWSVVWGLFGRLVLRRLEMIYPFYQFVKKRNIRQNNRKVENELVKKRKKTKLSRSKNAMLMFMLRALPLVVRPPPKTN